MYNAYQMHTLYTNTRSEVPVFKNQPKWLTREYSPSFGIYIQPPPPCESFYDARAGDPPDNRFGPSHLIYLTHVSTPERVVGSMTNLRY